MKKLIIVLIVMVFLVSYSFGCKKSDEAELSGKLAEEVTEAYQEEELLDSRYPVLIIIRQRVVAEQYYPGHMIYIKQGMSVSGDSGASD